MGVGEECGRGEGGWPEGSYSHASCHGHPCHRCQPCDEQSEPDRECSSQPPSLYCRPFTPPTLNAFSLPPLKALTCSRGQTPSRAHCLCLLLPLLPASCVFTPSFPKRSFPATAAGPMTSSRRQTPSTAHCPRLTSARSRVCAFCHARLEHMHQTKPQSVGRQSTMFDYNLRKTLS